MNESEFLVKLELAFSNIGYTIRKEILFPFVRMDRLVTNTCLSYFIEAESDAVTFGKGAQQLTMLKDQDQSTTFELNEYSKKPDLVLAVPDCSIDMRRRAENVGFRVIETQGVDKILETKVDPPTEPMPFQNIDLALLMDEMKMMFSYFGVHHKRSEKSETVLEISDPGANRERNWYPVLRVFAKGISFERIIFFPGIRETTISDGSREKQSQEFEALRKSIPSHFLLKELHIGKMQGRWGLGKPFGH